jgi:hypothetical protein
VGEKELPRGKRGPHWQVLVAALDRLDPLPADKTRTPQKTRYKKRTHSRTGHPQRADARQNKKLQAKGPPRASWVGQTIPFWAYRVKGLGTKSKPARGKNLNTSLPCSQGLKEKGVGWYAQRAVCQDTLFRRRASSYRPEGTPSPRSNRLGQCCATGSTRLFCPFLAHGQPNPCGDFPRPKKSRKLYKTRQAAQNAGKKTRAGEPKTMILTTRPAAFACRI